VSITIDEFKRIELRVGKVESAERVEGTEKLLKLIVDLGNEKRQIIAGIAEYYSPAELKGKYVVVVSNLQPKRIRGLESQGMLLATCDKPILLTIDKPDDKYVGERIC